jgi:hypothetical protein
MGDVSGISSNAKGNLLRNIFFSVVGS